MDKDTIEWLKLQVKEFVAVRATYETLAGKLREILETARDRYAPFGRVDARAKSIASFAEKALRKRGKYASPLERMTDLAGARVVAYTVDEAQAVCHFIEHEPGLRIDWKNSLDMRQQMKTEEFGYDAMHYVVELCEASVLGVSIPPEIQSIPKRRSYKAEIQVHTMLQNAWSVIGHDRLYKTQVKVPDAMNRELHAVAATLESVDRAFAASVRSLDHYIRHFEAYRTPTELEDDIQMWKAIHDEAPKDQAAIHQLGRCLMAAHRWKEAYKTLKKMRGVETVDALTDLGLSAARAGYVDKARRHLNRAVRGGLDDIRPWCALADTYRSTNLRQAILLYEEAFAIDPNEPAVLSPFVECHIRQDRSLARMQLMHGTLQAALCQCHERASRNVYVPQAHFNCARLHLYLGDAYAALNSYCMAIATCHFPQMITDELDALTAIIKALASGKSPRNLPESGELVGFEWARRLLIVSVAAGARRWKERAEEPGAKDWIKAGRRVRQRLRTLATPAAKAREAFTPPLVIVAGGCDRSVEGKLVRKYGRLLQSAFSAFSGTIISGGTTAGISGMVGQLEPLPGRELHRMAY